MSKKKAIGIDFGGTSIKTAVAQDGRIVERGSVIDTTRHAGPDSLIDSMFEVIAQLRKSHPEVEGVGIGLPGFVDGESGIVHHLSNVPGWHSVPMLKILEGRTGLRGAIENDANAMAFGEYRHGAAKGSRHVVCITLGTGVGCGLILDGRIFRGARYAAGEIGHSSIDLHGPRGVYETPGDLEVYVGNKQIGERASRLYTAAGNARTPEQCTPADLAKLAAGGDHTALALWDQLGTELGAALVNAIWLLNPDAIVIGGGVAKAGALIFEPVIRTIRERVSPLFHEQLKVVPAELGNDAGIIGAAELSLGN